jgi:Fe2+ or Zn2+ uptake regulation protein
MYRPSVPGKSAWSRMKLASAGMRMSGWRWRVLKHLAQQQQALTNPELFDLMNANGDPIQRPTLLRVLRDLEGAGLLRLEMKGDVRAYRLGEGPNARLM